MLVRKILFPTDFSDGSDAALVFASSLARDNNARLLVVHVHEPTAVYVEGLGAAYGALPQDQQRDARELLNVVEPSFPMIDIERRLLEGTPADAIVDLAEREEGIDLIVMGTHGRTGVSRMLMGSVAEKIVRSAPCPVLTIREPHKEPAL